MAHLLRDSDAMTIYTGCPEDRSRAMAEFYRDLLELQRVVFDCYSPRSLAGFYEGFLGVQKRLEDSAGRVELDLDDDDDLPNLAFQHSAQFRATRFPDPAYPAQLHIDYRFPDGAQPAIQRAERLGAIHMPPNEVTSQCYSDPAGHPFCL
ncbi:VOC family protein [Kribbella sp. NPDC049174]|uniref:VOC family protein n=1 Tax=Kribbella sp. NPDC049174 TaxID=3364112 RepID=UPI0037191A20